jgi:hypothetical protein
MHRIFVIGLITALIVTGALHYAPLWLFVLAIPIWAAMYLDAEERRIRAETVRRVREHLLNADDGES